MYALLRHHLDIWNVVHAHLSGSRNTITVQQHAHHCEMGDPSGKYTTSWRIRAKVSKVENGYWLALMPCQMDLDSVCCQVAHPGVCARMRQEAVCIMIE
jgi:hypothetical protein